MSFDPNVLHRATERLEQSRRQRAQQIEPRRQQI